MDIPTASPNVCIAPDSVEEVREQLGAAQQDVDSIPPSGMRNSKGRSFGEQVLWDLMGGSLLGIVSAGFLLVTQPSTTALLLAAPTSWLSKLEFLVLAGLCCGCGAAATGVILLLSIGEWFDWSATDAL